MIEDIPYFLKTAFYADETLDTYYERATGVKKAILEYHYGRNNMICDKDKAIYYFTECIKSTMKIKNYIINIDLLDLICQASDNIIEIEESNEIIEPFALNIIELSIIIIKKIYFEENPRLLYESIFSRTLDKVMDCYLDEEKFKEIIEINLKAKELYEFLNEMLAGYEIDIAGALYSIAQSYDCLKDYENTLKYAQDAMSIYEKIDVSDDVINTSLLGDCYKLMALSYENLNEIELAQEYYHKALDYYDVLQDVMPDKYLDSYQVLCMAVGIFYYNIEEISEAIYYYKKAINIESEEIEVIKNKITAIAYIVKLYKSEHDVENLILMATLGNDLSKRVIDECDDADDWVRQRIFYIYSALKEYYMEISDFEKEKYYKDLIEELMKD